MATATRRVKSVTYLGMEGTGATVTAAKESAKRALEASVTGSYAPIMVRWRGAIGLAWREPSPSGECWCYKILWPDSPVVEGAGMLFASCIHHTTREDMERSLVRHVVGGLWTHADGKEPPAILEHKDDRAEYVRMARWQFAAKHAKDVLGMTDSNLIHRWACENDHQF